MYNFLYHMARLLTAFLDATVSLFNENILILILVKNGYQELGLTKFKVTIESYYLKAIEIAVHQIFMSRSM